VRFVIRVTGLLTSYFKFVRRVVGEFLGRKRLVTKVPGLLRS